MPSLRYRPLTISGAFPAALAILFVSLVPNVSQAQIATVTVRAEDSAGPVEEVRVTVAGTSSLTDADGTARFRLPLGEHVIQTEGIGYAPSRVTLLLSAPADTLVVVRLAAQAVETEGIVVTSARTVRRIEDQPIRVEVVSREEVEEKLLMTPGDIAMLLNETAGLRVQPTAPSLGGASVRIQGLRGRYTQILSDGLPLYGGQAGALGPLQVPPMDLAQVEVIKGAASALYGPTALGGVVNLISRRPERAREVLLNLSTLGGTDAVGWLADELTDRWGYTLLASAHRQDHADVDGDGWADVPSFRRLALRPRLFWNDQQGGSANVTIGAMLEDRTGGTLPGRVTPAGTPYREALETRRLDGGFNGRKLISDRLSLSARASASVQGHDHRFGATRERDEHLTAFAELVLQGQDGRHLWLIGAAFQKDRYEARDLPVWSYDYTVPALFLQDEFEVSDQLTVAASLRYDHHSRYEGALSPRVSVLGRRSGWVVRVSAGAGYFAPTPFTEETEAVGLSRLVSTDPWVKERARSAMIDVGRNVGPVEVNLSAFGSAIHDPVQTLRPGDGTLSIRNAEEPVRTWGSEVFAALHQGSVHLVASYTYLRSTEPMPTGAGRRDVPLTPRHAVGIVGAYEQPTGRFGVELYYTGLQSLDEDPYRSTSESHIVLGFLVDRRFGVFRLFLNAENILDTRQTRWDALVRPAQTPDGRWTTDVWAPLEGRSFNGGVWISF
jgi:iron complex outermembrane receptor protein